MTAGGNFNVFAENWIYDNWRMGTMLFQVPGIFRDDHTPSHQLDNSHANRYYQNYMGFGPQGTPNGTVHPNGLDFWWDEAGVLNCWQENIPAPGHKIYSDPPYNTQGTYQGRPSIGGRPTGPPGPNDLPKCSPMDAPTVNPPINAEKIAFEAHCAVYTLNPDPLNPLQSKDPALCPFIHSPPVPPDRVPTGHGPDPTSPDPMRREVGPAPSGWSLGWVNPPQGTPARTSSPFGALPDISLSSAQAVAPMILLILLIAFFAGLRVGQGWFRGRARLEEADRD
jgi:hypothetical protein